MTTLLLNTKAIKALIKMVWTLVGRVSSIGIGEVSPLTLNYK